MPTSSDFVLVELGEGTGGFLLAVVSSFNFAVLGEVIVASLLVTPLVVLGDSSL